MKKRQLKISFSLALIVLFSILFQSIHSYEHFEKLSAQKRCQHKWSNSKEITHQHSKLEQCSVCQFTFGNYVAPELFVCQFRPNFDLIFLFFSSEKNIISFSGSLFVLRGPPSFIV